MGHFFALLYQARCLRSAYGASLDSKLAYQCYKLSAKGGVALAFNEIGDLHNSTRENWNKPYIVKENFSIALLSYDVGRKLDDPDSENKYKKLKEKLKE
jgi:hypothetical protein